MNKSTEFKFFLPNASKCLVFQEKLGNKLVVASRKNKKIKNSRINYKLSTNDQEVIYDESLQLKGYEVSLVINKGFKSNQAAVNFLQQKCLINVKWIEDYCLGLKIINCSERNPEKEHYLPPLIIPNDPNIKSLDLSGLIGRWYATGSLLSSIPDVDICPESSTDVNSDEIDDEENAAEPIANDSEDDEDTVQDADGPMEDVEDEESVVVYGFPSESSKLAQTLKDSGSCIFSTGNSSFQPNSLHGEHCKCKVFPWRSVDEIKEYIKIYNVAKALWYADPESQSYNDAINPWKPHERTIQNQIMDSTTTKDLYEPVMPKGLFPCGGLMKDYSRPTMERLWNNSFPPFLSEETKELPEFVNHSCVPGVRELSKFIKQEPGIGEFDLQELCCSSSNNGGESGAGISLDKPKKEEVKDDLDQWWEKIKMNQFDFRLYKTQILDPMMELHEENHAMRMEELDKKLFKKFHMEHKAIFESINPGQHLKILTEMKKWYLFNISKEVNIKINGSSGELREAKFLWVDIMPIIKNFVVPHTLMSYEKTNQ